MPNILIETGFLSNVKEAKNLTKKKYQDQIVEGIFEALINYKEKYESTIIDVN